MKYLVTGVAGFIGSSVAVKLLELGYDVIGIDNLNHYYDINLKLARLERIKKFSQFSFIQLDIADREGIAKLFAREQFTRVIHLAAQAGVRYSIDNPMVYADSNLVGHLTILEGCRTHGIEHLIYASSSSVYGLNTKQPFSTLDNVDHPASLYAATKKANELMSHSYSHLYDIPTTGLRFFSVYGPWGRPDMALFLFTKAILSGQAIDVYNHGKLSRDFTYIDDIVEGIIRIQDSIPTKHETCELTTNSEARFSPANSSAPYQIFNIGFGRPVKLEDFIKLLEKELGKAAKLNLLPMQAGDVYQTCADTKDLFKAIDYKPKVDIATGVSHFVKWYQGFYQT